MSRIKGGARLSEAVVVGDACSKEGGCWQCAAAGMQRQQGGSGFLDGTLDGRFGGIEHSKGKE